MTLLAPKTREGIEKLRKELRDYVLRSSSSPHIKRDLDLKSKNKMVQHSESGFQCLGRTFESAIHNILKRILVNEKGVLLINIIVSTDPDDQDDISLAFKSSPILAKGQREILLERLQPYVGCQR